MNNILRSLLILLLALPALTGLAQAPQSIPNPNVSDASNFIYDGTGALSATTAESINAKLAALRKTTTCEVAVAIVKSLDGLSIEDYSYQLFRHWGVGKKDKNNGVLLVVAPEEHKARIEVGSGAEGVLTDIVCSRILRNQFRRAAHSDNLSQAIYRTVDSIEEVLTNPKVAEELKSGQTDTTLGRMETLDSNVLWSFILLFACCVFIFTLVIFVCDFLSTRRHDLYRRAMTWRSHMPTYWWCAGLSLGAALPIAFVAWLLYRHARNGNEICDTCGAKMKKLSEEEDNTFLSASQDFEEKIGTVDYDVWVCPDCGTIERFPYVEKQLKYKECPNCHTIAEYMMIDKVVQPATTRREGIGERIYKCQFCGNERRERYRIPKKNDDSALLAAAALGAMAAGNRGGGGSFGGGFGGGHSSGGGASTNW